VSEFDKYLSRANATIPQDHHSILSAEKDIDLSLALDINQVDELFERGYLDCESGFRRNQDGSIYVAVLIEMPEVSLDMINWWFWWHAAEAVRYQIWYPDMHFDNSADFLGRYDDESMSYADRLHLSTHHVTEDVGIGKDEILIDFMHPKDFGFNHEKLDLAKQTIICARVGSPEKGVWGTRMCHFVRTTDTGVEMRSRFWIGQEVYRMGGIAQGLLNKVLNQAFVKRKLIPANLGPKMFHHCTQEYHNLAEILPELYEKYGAPHTA